MRTTRIALVLMAALLVAACGPGGPGVTQVTEADIELTAPVEVTLWHNQTGELAKGFQEMVDEFNRTNAKKITVKPEFQGNYTQIYQKTLAAIQAGTLPDGVVAVESQVADYAKAGVVVDLDPYIKGKNGLSKQSLDDIYKPYLDANRYSQYDNKLLSFPFIKSLEVIFQNDDLAKELGVAAPKSWEDFEKNAKAALKKGADGKVTRWGAMTWGVDFFHAQVMSRGGKMWSEDGKTVGWDGAPGLETLKLLQRGIEGGWMYQPKGFDWQNVFGEGNLLYAIGTSTGRPFIKAAFKKQFSWSVVPMPTSAGVQPRTIQFGGVIAIMKTTPEKQLAVWEFLKWFTDTKQTAKWSIVSSYMPVRKTALEDAALKEHWTTKDVQGRQSFDLVPTSISAPNVRGTQDIRNVITDMQTKVTTKKATPEDALKEAVAKASQILKENQ